MFVFSLVALTVVAVVVVVALNAGRIPVLRDLIGAAPLQPEPDDARDFAATDAAGYITRPGWGPDKPRLELPGGES